VVVGVDPGTASVGLAVVARNGSRPSVTWAGAFRTPAGLAPAERLRRIHDAVAELIVEHEPSALALERLMWGKNVDSAMAVARSSGAIMVAAARAGLPVHEYAPLEVKMAVTGVGNAPKDQVRRALDRVLGVEGVPTQPDAADAVAVAVCHLQQSRFRALAARADGGRG